MAADNLAGWSARLIPASLNAIRLRGEDQGVVAGLLIALVVPESRRCVASFSILLFVLCVSDPIQTRSFDWSMLLAIV